MDIIPLSALNKSHRQLIGGKGYALGQLISLGYNVPPGFCVTTLVYDQFLDQTGLRDLITLELNRKNMGEMRWEEIWDTALRIRNLFLRMPFPANLKEAFKAHCDHYFQTDSVVVRSSACDEDSAGSSFAGLHESYVNLRGFDAIIKHIQLVWASLWSDRALLYRRELGLEVEYSAMAVIVQRLVQSLKEFSGLAWGTEICFSDQSKTIKHILQLASKALVEKDKVTDQKNQQMQDHFLSHFQGEQLKFALQLLELARVSYKIRDDDNIYLGRIESQVIKATELAKNRLAAKGDPDSQLRNANELIALLSNPGQVPKTKHKKRKNKQPSGKLKARQIIGQPAVAGLSSGIARVVLTSDDLFDFKAGEILVCTAIDPNMTFVVPLAAAIVECRGGMLIHGAIIAREYGIPCVTGIPLATSRISTGDKVTVDGFLGIVTVDKKL